MHSIRTKITAITMCAIVIVMVVATVYGVTAIRSIGSRSADQTLLLLCETGQKNLDHYLNSVEQSVEMVSAYVQSDLNGVDDARLQAHLERVRDIFQKMTYKTSGVLTYYYRIDPTVSQTARGFWYVNLDGSGFVEHEVTDISQYDTEDTTQLVWFTVPKATGEGVWLPPYITDNLDVRVISYNVPVYFEGQFVGVIGIEMDYTGMAEQVDHIALYDNGYAFLNDAEGSIIYHPRMDVTAMETKPKVPAGLLTDDTFIRYDYDGVEKQAVWLPLSNGMRLNVTVPVDEINADWQHWSARVITTFVILLAVFLFLILAFANRITRPLRKLTEAAEQIDQGNFDCQLDYNGRDEVGTLTRTFQSVTANLKAYITNLNDLAYADTLTSLHNRGAFDISVRNIQTQLDAPGSALEFAVCIFDCNSLKSVNDENGHDKGDIYLKETATIICEVFDHSPVFRIGGDEFAALLLDRDYKDRDALLRLFDEKCAVKRSQETDAWTKVDAARGMAVYDPREDSSVSDVVRRADKYMYEDKWRRKHQLQAQQEGQGVSSPAAAREAEQER